MSNPVDILAGLTTIKDARSKRASSYDRTGRNDDFFFLEPGETRVLMEADGPGRVTHLWFTGQSFVKRGKGWFGAQDPDWFRKIVIRMYWDGERNPSVNCPLGDFFCLGNSIATNFQSLPFTASMGTWQGPTDLRWGKFGGNVALNCYLPMPFARHARIELVNENSIQHKQYFYIDYELCGQPLPEGTANFHAQWRRANPCPGWAPEIPVNTPPVDIPNFGENNYCILDARGRGHYIGCNLSVTNFQGTWWGEGDDMIFIDGEKFPPSLHGTGSEDYLNQAWGMQDNAYLFNGSAKWEHNPPFGYQTSYVFHLTNPVRFRKSVKVTIEAGHGNHLANEYSSTAYWYQWEPHKSFDILPVEKRLPVRHPELGLLPIIDVPGYKAPKLTLQQKRIKAKYVEEAVAEAACQRRDWSAKAAEQRRLVAQEKKRKK